MPDNRTTIAYEILPAWTCPVCRGKNVVKVLPKEHTAAACFYCGTVALVIFHGPPERPAAEIALERIALITGISVNRIREHTRYKEEVQARHLACYVLYNFCGLSLVDTGKHIDRDHSSVIHGVRKIEQTLRTEPAYRELVTRILTSLGIAPDPALGYGYGKAGGNENGRS